MRFFTRVALLVTVLVLSSIGVVAPGVAFGDRERDDFNTRLVGLNEVPSINTEGNGNLRLRVTADRIEFELKYANLSGNPTVAHIHFGERRTNGAVMVFFCGGGGKPACPASPSGTVSGTIVAGDVVGPAVQGIDPGNFAAVLRAIRSGAAYANMHSAKFPSGEIRGQIERNN